MTETAPQAAHLLLVDAQALPDIYEKVLEAKRLLAAGRASSAAEAARMTGISRSAFYKYKDAVFPYSGTESGRLLTVHCILEDRPGVLSNLLAAFAAADANILTVNQSIPVDALASVSISASTDRLCMPFADFVRSLGQLDGVQSIARIERHTAGLV